MPAPAPLPVYQRRYSGERYPRAEQQQAELQSHHYRYKPRNEVARQHYEHPSHPGHAAPQEQHGRDKGKDKGEHKGKGRDKRDER